MLFLVEIFIFILFFVAFMVTCITMRFGSSFASTITAIITGILGVTFIVFEFMTNLELFIPKMLVFIVAVACLLVSADDLYEE